MFAEKSTPDRRSMMNGSGLRNIVRAQGPGRRCMMKMPLEVHDEEADEDARRRVKRSITAQRTHLGALRRRRRRRQIDGVVRAICMNPAREFA